MPVKTTVAAVQDIAASILSSQTYLRIAIPSWRSIGINTYAPEELANPSLSREEIQSLFHGELRGKSRKKNPLTETEVQEKRLADRVRRALYPAQSAAQGHNQSPARA